MFRINWLLRKVQTSPFFFNMLSLKTRNSHIRRNFVATRVLIRQKGARKKSVLTQIAYSSKFQRWPDTKNKIYFKLFNPYLRGTIIAIPTSWPTWDLSKGLIIDWWGTAIPACAAVQLRVDLSLQLYTINESSCYFLNEEFYSPWQKTGEWFCGYSLYRGGCKQGAEGEMTHPESQVTLGEMWPTSAQPATSLAHL